MPHRAASHAPAGLGCLPSALLAQHSPLAALAAAGAAGGPLKGPASQASSQTAKQLSCASLFVSARCIAATCFRLRAVPAQFVLPSLPVHSTPLRTTIVCSINPLCLHSRSSASKRRILEHWPLRLACTKRIHAFLRLSPCDNAHKSILSNSSLKSPMHQ